MWIWRLLVAAITMIGGAIAARTYAQPVALPPQPVRPSPPPQQGDDNLGAMIVDGPTIPSLNEALRPGWSRPGPAVIPRPSYWPMLLALGVALMFWGIIATFYLWALGFIVFVIGVGGWIGELIHESQ